MQNETLEVWNPLSPSIVLPGDVAVYEAVEHRAVDEDVGERRSPAPLGLAGVNLHQATKQRGLDGDSQQRLPANLRKGPAFYIALGQRSFDGTKLRGPCPLPVSEDINPHDIIGDLDDRMDGRTFSSYGHVSKGIAKAIPVVLPPVLDTANRFYDFFQDIRKSKERQQLTGRSVVNLGQVRVTGSSKDLAFKTFKSELLKNGVLQNGSWRQPSENDATRTHPVRRDFPGHDISIHRLRLDIAREPKLEADSINVDASGVYQRDDLSHSSNSSFFALLVIRDGLVARNISASVPQEDR